MSLIDTHCHIDLYDEPGEVLDEAREAGGAVLAVTNAPFVFKACQRLVAGRSDVWTALGLHPELVGEYAHQVGQLLELMDETRFIGEVGLDYRVTDSATHELQRQVFSKILDATQARPGMVLTIHSRGAEADVVSMIDGLSQSTTILHWYSGAIKHLERAQQLGSYFSVNPAMLASKNGRKLVSRMNPSRVLTESDGPLAKVNGRGARPADVAIVVAGLAKIWGHDREATEHAIMANWIRAVCEH